MLRLTRKFLMVVEIFSYQKMIKNEALSLKMEKIQCKLLQERNCTSKTGMNHDALEILCLNALHTSILRFSTLDWPISTEFTAVG